MARKYILAYLGAIFQEVDERTTKNDDHVETNKQSFEFLHTILQYNCHLTQHPRLFRNGNEQAKHPTQANNTSKVEGGEVIGGY